MMDVKELQRRSAMVPRLKEGQPMVGPATKREISSLLLDNAAALRTWVMSREPVNGAAAIALTRIIGLACEFSPFVFTDLTEGLDTHLPKGGGA